MEKMIDIQELNFNYQETKGFFHFDLSILKGSFTTILGPNGSGKSTLLKLLVGLLECDSNIEIDGVSIKESTLREIRKKIGIVLPHTDTNFVAETVVDELAFSLENMGYPKEKIKKRIEEVAKMLELATILEKSPDQLTSGEKQRLSLGTALIHEPKLLLLDEAFTKLNLKEKQLVEKLLKDCSKTGMTILNVTQNTEESLFGDDIVLLSNFSLIAQGKKEDILKEEKLFHQLGLSLPFLAELSLKLQYYGLVDHLILDMEKMVNTIWK